MGEGYASLHCQVNVPDQQQSRGVGEVGGSAVPPSAGGALNILVTFADTPTRERAVRIHGLLVDELGEDYSLHFTWWKFNLFACADLFEVAVEEAVKADMLLFSVHAAERWPPRVQSWIEAWKHKREQRRRAPLGAWVGGADQLTCQLSPAHAALQRVAYQAGMEFSPHVFPLQSEAPCCLVDRSSGSARHIKGVLERILTRSSGVPDWGINE